jgi:type VI secretion system protein ImpC
MLARAQGPAPARPKDPFSALLEQVTRPHLEEPPDTRVRERESSLARQLGAILHDPNFQSLEAMWRGLEFLVRAIEGEPRVGLYLMDVSLAEFRADPATVVRAVQSSAVKTPWAVIAGIYTFGETVEDLVLLSTLGQVAAREKVSFIAGASSRLLGCESLAKTPGPQDWKTLPELTAKVWKAIRSGGEARSIGLLAPRFLLRLPYGRETNPVERLAFEEFSAGVAHENYLWGNPAWACLSILAASFRADGWDMRPGKNLRIADRPLHILKRDGESVAQPCTEALLSDDAIEAILDQGVMPLAPVRNQDAFYVARIQSIADPPTGLAGGWRSSA